jgi:hypothetical protein
MALPISSISCCFLTPNKIFLNRESYCNLVLRLRLILFHCGHNQFYDTGPWSTVSSPDRWQAEILAMPEARERRQSGPAWSSSRFASLGGWSSCRPVVGVINLFSLSLTLTPSNLECLYPTSFFSWLPNICEFSKEPHYLVRHCTVLHMGRP